MLTLLVKPLFCCLNCPQLPENALPEDSQVSCPGCGAVLVEKLPDEEPCDGA